MFYIPCCGVVLMHYNEFRVCVRAISIDETIFETLKHKT